MKNYVQRGENLTLPAPNDLASGDGVLLGSIFGVAAETATPGSPVDVVTTGVFDLPKVAADVFAPGDAAYWDDTAKLVTADDAAGANSKIGVAIADSAAATASARVRLNGVF